MTKLAVSKWLLRTQREHRYEAALARTHWEMPRQFDAVAHQRAAAAWFVFSWVERYNTPEPEPWA